MLHHIPRMLLCVVTAAMACQCRLLRHNNILTQIMEDMILSCFSQRLFDFFIRFDYIFHSFCLFLHKAKFTIEQMRYLLYVNQHNKKKIRLIRECRSPVLHLPLTVTSIRKFPTLSDIQAQTIILLDTLLQFIVQKDQFSVE